MADTRLRAEGLASAAPAAIPRESPAAGPAPDRRLVVVRELRDFARLGAPWRDLEARAEPRRSVFQSFDWLKAWAETYGPGLGKSPLHVVLGYRGGELAFAWPLMRTRSGPLTVLRWMSEPFSQYGDVLAARGEAVSGWMTDALAEIRTLGGADALRLRHVRADAAARPFLERAFRDARFSETAPFLDLSAFADEAAYDARYSSTQRKRRKKIRKSLEDDFGPVSFHLLAGHEAAAAIGRAVAEKSQWIEERGRQNRALGCPSASAFLKDLALSSADASLRLVVSEMCAGGKPISWEIGLRAGNAHYAFITSHVTALTDYSPARLHMDLAQRQALKDGCAVFDLMLPHDAYKDSWSSGATGAEDYHLPLTAAGWLYGGLYLERLRPLLRSAYYRMPPALLRLLKPVIGH